MIASDEIIQLGGPYIRGIFRFLTITLVAPGGLLLFFLASTQELFNSPGKNQNIKAILEKNARLFFKPLIRLQFIFLSLFTAIVWTSNFPYGINGGGPLGAVILALALLPNITKITRISLFFFTVALTPPLDQPHLIHNWQYFSLFISSVITIIGAFLTLSLIGERKGEIADPLIKNCSLILLAGAIIRILGENVPEIARIPVFFILSTFFLSHLIQGISLRNHKWGPSLLIVASLIFIFANQLYSGQFPSQSPAGQPGNFPSQSPAGQPGNFPSQSPAGQPGNFPSQSPADLSGPNRPIAPTVWDLMVAALILFAIKTPWKYGLFSLILCAFLLGKTAAAGACLCLIFFTIYGLLTFLSGAPFPEKGHLIFHFLPPGALFTGFFLLIAGILNSPALFYNRLFAAIIAAIFGANCDNILISNQNSPESKGLNLEKWLYLYLILGILFHILAWFFTGFDNISAPFPSAINIDGFFWAYSPTLCALLILAFSQVFSFFTKKYEKPGPAPDSFPDFFLE